MYRPARRRVLRAGCLVAAGVLTGCASTPVESGTTSPTGTDTGPSGSPTRTTDDDASLTDWERSTDCEGEYDGMHDSVIEVERVTDSLGDEYAPIHFSDLSADEQSIIRTVTEEGGYSTCNASEAFDKFVERVIDHRRQQNKDAVYLEREDTYYQLYVEKLDQVYAH